MITNWSAVSQILEAVMLVCFGVSWPFSIYKTWKAKRTEGKSIVFLIMVFAGYWAGVTSKLCLAFNEGTRPETVTILYVVNGVLVGIDILLYVRYRKKPSQIQIPSPD